MGVSGRDGGRERQRPGARKKENEGKREKEGAAREKHSRPRETAGGKGINNVETLTRKER